MNINLNRRKFLIKSLEGIIVGIPVIYYCGKNPVSPEQYRSWAHGYWKATSGNLNVTNEIGLIAYNFYGIDTKSKDDDVIVIWDNGVTCVFSSAYMKDNSIELQVYDVTAKFEIKNNIEAIAYFTSNDNSYVKGLTKIGDNPHPYGCI